MSKAMTKLTWIVLALAGPVFAECAPPQMVRIETRNVTPGLAAGDFAALPKVMYRLGNGRIRLEEQPDPGMHVQLLFLIDAPNSWSIDLEKKVGEHAVDEAESKTVRAPVFSDEGLPKEVSAIEFGCEDAFVKDPSTTHGRLQTSSGVALEHSVVSGPWKATLIYREGTPRPHSALLSKDGKVVMAITYVSYHTVAVVPEGFFAPPADVQITEPKPGQ
jgi:hypothetical protein